MEGVEFTWLTLAFVCSLVLLGGILKSWVGFGSSICFMLVWTFADLTSIYTPGPLALSLSFINVMHFSANVPLLVIGLSALDVKLLISFLPGILLVPVGTRLVKYLSAAWLELVLGFLFFFFSIWRLFRDIKDYFANKKSPKKIEESSESCKALDEVGSSSDQNQENEDISLLKDVSTNSAKGQVKDSIVLLEEGIAVENIQELEQVGHQQETNCKERNQDSTKGSNVALGKEIEIPESGLVRENAEVEEEGELDSQPEVEDEVGDDSDTDVPSDEVENSTATTITQQWRWSDLKQIIKERKYKWALLCASISGLLSGLFGIGGPPLMVYFSLFPVNKSTMRSVNVALNLPRVCLAMISLYYEGLFPISILWPVYLSEVVVAQLAVFLGNKLHLIFSSKQVMVIVLLILGVQSIWLIIASSISLFH